MKDPLSIQKLSFQLTFLATFSLLVFTPIFNHWLTRILPKRSQEEVEELPILDKIGAKCTSFIRPLLALNVGVTLLILPLLLYHFHTFPLLSLLYNLFIPLGIALAFSALLLSLILYPWIPTLSHLLFTLNTSFSSFLLDMMLYAPKVLNMRLSFDKMPLPLVLILLFVFSIWGLLLLEEKKTSTHFLPI